MLNNVNCKALRTKWLRNWANCLLQILLKCLTLLPMKIKGDTCCNRMKCGNSKNENLIPREKKRIRFCFYVATEIKKTPAARENERENISIPLIYQVSSSFRHCIAVYHLPYLELKSYELPHNIIPLAPWLLAFWNTISKSLWKIKLRRKQIKFLCQVVARCRLERTSGDDWVYVKTYIIMGFH